MTAWKITYYAKADAKGGVVGTQVLDGTKKDAAKWAAMVVNSGRVGSATVRRATAAPRRRNVPSTTANTMRANPCGCQAPKKNHHLRVGQAVVTAEGQHGEVVATIPPDTYRVRLAAQPSAGIGPREVVVDGATLRKANARRSKR